MWDGQMPRGNWMESAGKCPTIARGGWALLELTDALQDRYVQDYKLSQKFAIFAIFVNNVYFLFICR